MSKSWLYLLFFVACGSRPVTDPPPILLGKCIADEYVGEIAMKQSCNYNGYGWHCSWDRVNSCKRVGPAWGELK